MISDCVSRYSFSVGPHTTRQALVHLQKVIQAQKTRPALRNKSCCTDHAEQPMASRLKDRATWTSSGGLELLPAILLAIALLACPVAASAAMAVQGPAHVVDGDTIVVAGERIRLFGLDAPEKGQVCQNKSGKGYPCGLVAKKALEKRIESKSVTCEVRNRDLYGRMVSKCVLDGKGDIGHWLVSSGHAIAYRQYSQEYVRDEEHAHAAHRGIWAGSFEVPADWRKNNKGKYHVKTSSQGTHRSKKHTEDLCSKLGLLFNSWKR